MTAVEERPGVETVAWEGDGDSPSTRPLRVLQLIDSMGVGGAEHLVAHLAEALRAGGMDAAIATLRTPLEPGLDDALRARGIQLETFPMTDRERAGARLAPRQLLRLIRFVRRERFDLINTHLNTSDVVGALVGWTCRVPVVSTQHSVRVAARHPLRDRVRRFLMRHAVTERIAVGHAVADAQQHADDGAPMSVIPNPAPPPATPDPLTRARVRWRLGLHDAQPVVLAVGRLEPPKDHLMLLEAMSRLLDELPSAALLIAGDGTLAGSLQERVAELGLDDHVHLLGHRDDVDELYATADVFVSSSAWEGMPLAILEAMAVGLPVVATDVGDCREVIGDGGYVVPPGDPGSLAQALREALHPATRRTRGRAAQERVAREYSAESWIRRVAQVYGRAASGSTP